MSAIFGIVRSETPIDEELQKMEHALNYWRADKSNIWKNDKVGMGHLMLHNTLESLHEELPFFHPEANVVITADARIDNRTELTNLLNLKNLKSPITDSQLILFAYLRYDADCVKHLVGDFAFAIWDTKKQTLFCARDQVGIKPFFYAYKNGNLLFASEKKGLLSLPELDRSINIDYFYRFLLKPSIQDSSSTVYETINRLPPATSLIFKKGTQAPTLNRYWTLDPTKKTIFRSKDEYIEGMVCLFEQSVRCRLRTQYPVGAELSGGIDSSTIVGVADHILVDQDKKIIPFSSTFEPSTFANQNAADREEQFRIFETLKFNNITKFVFITKQKWNDPLEEIDLMLKINDGLELFTQTYQLAIKAEAMTHNIRVLLSGNGGDELVSYKGEHASLLHFYHGNYRQYFSTKKLAPGFLLPFYGPELEYILHKMKNFFSFYTRDNLYASFIFPVPLKSKLKRADILFNDANYRNRYLSYGHYLAYRILKSKVSLRYESETRSGYYFKMEPRFPMVDIRLIEYFLSLPDSIKIVEGRPRVFFREALGNYMPEAIRVADNKNSSITPYKPKNEKFMLAQKYLLERMTLVGNKPQYKYKSLLENVGKDFNILKYCLILRWLEKDYRNQK